MKDMSRDPSGNKQQSSGKQVSGSSRSGNSRIVEARETFSTLLETARLLNTGLDAETLAICVRLCEQGANPEALATVIRELRRESASIRNQEAEAEEPPPSLDVMGVSVLQLYPLPDGKTGQQTIETLTKRIMNLGATQTAPFVVDCEVYTSQNTPNKTLYVLHNSEFPATVFSILESGNKTVTLTSANLFDLLMLKLGQVYQRKGTNAKIESKGPRFEIKDFVVKLGSVTTAGSFKGILVEVEYCPCLVPDNCWSLLAEFMQGFLGSCVSSIPSPYIKAKGNTTFTPEDTIRQYLDHFNQFRKSAKVF